MARCITRGDIFDRRPCSGMPKRKERLRRHVSCFERKIKNSRSAQEGWSYKDSGRAAGTGTGLENLRIVQDDTAHGGESIWMPESCVSRIIETMDGRRRERGKSWLRIRDKLVLDHTGHVEHEVFVMTKKTPMSVSEDDLMGPAITALIKQAERYIPSMGKFWNYAAQRIRGAMLDWMREQDWVARTDRIKHKADNDFEIHEQIHLSEDPDLNIFEQFGQTDKRFKQLEDNEWLERIMRGFSKQERSLVQLYAFDGLTMRECGIKLKISESRVCQIWTQIIEFARRKAHD